MSKLAIVGTASDPQIVSRAFRTRSWQVTVAGAVLPQSLSVEFEIEKTKKPEPNSCRLKIYNLSPSSRSALAALSQDLKQNDKGTGKGSFKNVGLQSGHIRVEIEAGYEEAGRSLIFRGDLRSAITERSGPDVVTTIFGEDGGSTTLAARVSASFPPGASVEAVARFCAARMGVGVGNLPAVFAGGLVKQPPRSLTVFERGTTLSGSAPDELRRLLAPLGVSFSIQDGVIHCRTANGYTPSTIVLLSAATGLVGSPARDTNGYVNAKCLIQPGLFVDGRVRFQTLDLEGDYVIHGVKYNGASDGQDWYAELSCKAV